MEESAILFHFSSPKLVPTNGIQMSDILLL